MVSPAQKIAIIDYGSGNLRSVAKAFERVIAEHALPAQVEVTDDSAVVRAADRIVLPGVGAFAACMNGLVDVSGMVEALEYSVLEQKRPFLGICVGMQLLATRGLEFGETAGLGWVPGTVQKITPAGERYKIPHMGWNEVMGDAHPVLPAAAHAYFVHSFQFLPEDAAHVLATTSHGTDIVAAIGRDNMIGVQFHPEKSQAYGLELVRRFIEWTPES
jgi:glutamine amidotransferase